MKIKSAGISTLPEPILLEDTKKIGRIGDGCLNAVVAHTGYFLKKTNLEDDYGVDFELKELVKFNGKRRELSTYFKIQLKTSYNWSIRDDKIVYDLESKTYNDIVMHNQFNVTKLILVIMCLQNDEINWCSLNHEFIRFQNSLFWFHTESKDSITNTGTKRIEIPLTQVFNKNAITKLISNFQVKIIK
jgi:hypothetical protein